jgi:hypothetical protein
MNETNELENYPTEQPEVKAETTEQEIKQPEVQPVIDSRQMTPEEIRKVEKSGSKKTLNFILGFFSAILVIIILGVAAELCYLILNNKSIVNSVDFLGKYQHATFDSMTTLDEEVAEVVSYDGYIEKLNEAKSIAWIFEGDEPETKEEELSEYYTDKTKNYIILFDASGWQFCTMSLESVTEGDDEIYIIGEKKKYGCMGMGSGYFIAIPTDKPVGTCISFTNTAETSTSTRNTGVSAKPIIYLYPTDDTEVTVTLGSPENLTCSYPNYTTEWNVLAKSNGDLVDLDTGKNLYALYYESENNIDFKVEEEGFVVKGEDTAEFLEEKLAILGLSERESEEFIVYWLPRLQENNYNYIRFATAEEIEANMSLDFSVEPDSLIRVLMVYEGLDEPIDVEEQQLETPVREGFTVVEWGGTEITNSNQTVK